MDLRYSFDKRTERLVASGRVVLASFSLFAIWLDPSEPAKYAGLAYSLLIVYLFYALVMALVVWRSHRPLISLRLVTHVFDLGAFALFMYFTEGATSPFFAYFVFSIVCATLRWQWHGALWTSFAALAIFLGLGIYGGEILQDPAFELNRFIIRAVYLAVVAALLGYLGAHEFERRDRLAQLAAWSHPRPLAMDKGVAQILEQASAIVGVPRVLMAWEEAEEPWLHLAVFSAGRFEWTREPPGSFSSLVDSFLENKDFFADDARGSTAIVGSSPAAVESWSGEPINRELRERFRMESVLSAVLKGENCEGRMFFLDKSALTPDDLIWAEVVASRAAATMDLFYLLQRLQQTAAAEERIRLARELHDGVAQALTAAGLRLEVALEILATDPDMAKEHLENVQNLVLQGQRDVRSLMKETKSTPFARTGV